tara:strand:- start:358 stop:462 length:105 start_codon:yes stop_codon:yes gene_type:complete
MFSQKTQATQDSINVSIITDESLLTKEQKRYLKK